MTDINAYYNQNVGLVHAVARKGFARLTAANVGIDYDDVFQEMSVVFLKAYEKFDASKGFKFSTYFFMSAFNRLNSWAGDMIDERCKHGILSIDEINHVEGEESLTMDEALMVDNATPDAIYRGKQFVEHIAKSLSPLAELILTWTIMPPEPLVAEVQKQHMNGEFARSIGKPGRHAKISPRFVGDFLRLVSDVKRTEIDRALAEIANLRYKESKNYLGE